jgi:hypothetical protein
MSYGSFIPLSAPPHKLETDWAEECADVILRRCPVCVDGDGASIASAVPIDGVTAHSGRQEIYAPTGRRAVTLPRAISGRRTRSGTAPALVPFYNALFRSQSGFSGTSQRLLLAVVRPTIPRWHGFCWSWRVQR